MTWVSWCLMGVLRWGADLQGGAPYAFQDPADPSHLLGFEVELADALAQRLGDQAKFVQTDWTTLTAGLQRDTYDIALNGLEETPARRETLALTRPYYRFDLQLVTRAPDVTRYPDAAALRDRTVGTLEGTLAADHLKSVGAHLKLYQGVEEPYLDLQQGRLDAVLMDSVIGDVYGKKPGLSVALPSLAAGEYVIACSKARADYCARVDEALGQLRTDGTLRSILTKYQLWNAAQESLSPRANTTNTGNTAAHFGAAHVWAFVEAAGVTLGVSVAAMLLAALSGLALATARGFGGAWLSRAAGLVVETLRGTPVLLQLYVVYFGLAPYLALPPIVAAILTLGFNYGAYESEIYRAGLSSVPRKQWDAGLALGLSRRQTFRHVVLPQAVRVALPGMANDFVALLKDSALVSVITVVELTKQMAITAVDVRSWLWPGAVCALLYMAMSYPASRLGLWLEHRLRRGEEA